VKTTYADIDAFDAESKLLQLLHEVRHGRRYRIKVDGHSIADLVPSKRAVSQDVHASIEQMRNIRKIGSISAENLTVGLAEGDETKRMKLSDCVMLNRTICKMVLASVSTI